MIWNATHIFWPQQLLVLSIVLPPVFIALIALGLGAPRLFAKSKPTEHKAQELHASARPVHSSR
jgi:hypothetical protein